MQSKKSTWHPQEKETLQRHWAEKEGNFFAVFRYEIHEIPLLWFLPCIWTDAHQKTWMVKDWIELLRDRHLSPISHDLICQTVHTFGRTGWLFQKTGQRGWRQYMMDMMMRAGDTASSHYSFVCFSFPSKSCMKIRYTFFRHIHTMVYVHWGHIKSDDDE